MLAAQLMQLNLLGKLFNLLFFFLQHPSLFYSNTKCMSLTQTRKGALLWN